MRTLENKISRSNIRLMVDKEKKGWGFYASILFQMQMLEKEDIGTMATDGKNIFYNAEWSDTLTEEELDFVRCHEGMHRVLRHHLRQKHRDQRLWNVATDYAINSVLTQSGMTMPKDGLFDSKYHGMSAEKIYAILEKEMDKTEQCSWGGVSSSELNEDEIKQEENIIMQQTTMALQNAKDIGSLPKDIKDIIQEMERSQVDWSSVIRRVVGGDQPEDYTYRRPNRRALNCFDIFNPSTLKIGCGDVVIWVDTSASVSNKELKHALGEINAISEDMQPNSVTLIYADTDIQKVQRFEKGDIITELNVVGRGGTCPMCVFNHIDENHMNVDSMV